MIRAISNSSPLSSLAENFFSSLQPFDQIVNKWFERDFHSSSDFYPPTDISATKDYYLITMDLPGVEEKNIHIQVEDNNSLTIQGQRLKEKSKKKENYSYIERTQGEFKRIFYLSSHIDKENIQAQCGNGILEILVPKKEKGSPVKIETNKNKTQTLSQKYLGKAVKSDT